MSQTTELLLRIRQQGGEQLTRLQNSLKNLGQQSTATNVNFKELSTELKRIQQTSVQSVNNLRGYATAWREIANSVKIGTAEFKQASAEAAKLEAQLEKTQGKRGRLAAGAQIAGTIAGAGVFGGIEGGIGAGIGGLIGGVPGAITGGAIGAQVGMFRQMLGGVATFAADLSRQRQALQLVTQDAGEYQRALTFIDRTSRELAIPQEIITRQFTQLTASVKGAGGNVRDAEKAFLGIAAGIRGTGGSLEQLDSALTATSQVFSKGKVSAEELRQQIGERLPGAFSLFAKSIGMTPQELDKALEKGQVSLQDFQKFSEELFKKYGENAKIIADGPDAAGDRLKVSLSKLQEAIGPILKDIGASFQNFAAEAIQSFINLGKELGKFGAQMEEKLGGKLLDNAIRNVKTQDAIIKRLEAEQAVRIDGLTKLEKQQLSLARTLRAGSMKVIEGAKFGPSAPTTEPPSKLPGIDTTKTGDGGESRLKKLQSDFERSVAVLGRQFNVETRKQLLDEVLKLEDNISKALDKGNTKEADRLELLQKRRTLEITRDVLINEEDKLEQKINEGKTKGLDLTNAQNRLAEIRNEREQTLLAITKLDNQEKRTSISLMEQLQEEAAKFNAQFAYDGNAMRMPTLFQAFQDQIESLREEMKDTFPEIMQMSDDLASAFGSAFESMVFSGQSARESLGKLFEDIAKSFQRMVVQMLVDYLKLQIINIFKNIFAPSPVSISNFNFTGAEFTGGTFGVDTGGLAGPASPFAMGGIMTPKGPMLLKKYSAGGIARGPQMALYGEGSRPEAYVPLPDGRTIPVTMSNGGETVINVSVDAKGSNVQGNEGQSRQLGVAISAAVQQELIKQRRPGGLLAG